MAQRAITLRKSVTAFVKPHPAMRGVRIAGAFEADISLSVGDPIIVEFDGQEYMTVPTSATNKRMYYLLVREVGAAQLFH